MVDALRRKGIPAAHLDSTSTAADVFELCDDLAAGKLRILYIAPERFVSEAFMSRIRKARIDLLAIDEAHCISEWGHNFRPEYLRLAALTKKLRIPRVVMIKMQHSL